MKHQLLWIGSLLLLSTCVERIELNESLSGEPLLVVSGGITNARGPYRVTLAYVSTTLQAFDGQEVSGAAVHISDGEGQRATLAETVEPGTYETDTTAFRGEVGETYTLHITTPDGRTYASLPETMLPVPPIDTIYYALESRTRVNALNEVSKEWGLQFYLINNTYLDPPSFW